MLLSLPSTCLESSRCNYNQEVFNKVLLFGSPLVYLALPWHSLVVSRKFYLELRSSDDRASKVVRSFINFVIFLLDQQQQQQQVTNLNWSLKSKETAKIFFDFNMWRSSTKIGNIFRGNFVAKHTVTTRWQTTMVATTAMTTNTGTTKATKATPKIHQWQLQWQQRQPQGQHQP